MELPSNFAGKPGEEPHHYFRNICIAFRKQVKESTNIDELEMGMENFLNAGKAMHWKHENNGTYKKDLPEKTMKKVWTEFARYIESLRSGNALPSQDLVESISAVEDLIDDYISH